MNSLFKAYSEEETKNRKINYPQQNLAMAMLSAPEVLRGRIPRVNMRTFLFNYRRYLKDKFKKKDLVSVKRAKDLNNLLSTYINDFHSSYPKFILSKISRHTEKEKRLVLQDILPWEIYLQVSRKDLETFHMRKLNTEFAFVEKKLKEYNNSPFNTTIIQRRFKELCGDLPVSWRG
jgi:hypothetical protein